jgi:hypothetical protein
MAENVLMQKGEATMNVPPDKVKAYAEDGWIVIDRPAEPKPEAEKPIEPQAEGMTIEEAVEKIGKKKSAKK